MKRFYGCMVAAFMIILVSGLGQHCYGQSPCMQTWIGLVAGYDDGMSGSDGTIDFTRASREGYTTGRMLAIKVIRDGENIPPRTKESTRILAYFLTDRCMNELGPMIGAIVNVSPSVGGR